jgi:phage repressor protein C with HTH and peptisase S24 domain
MPPNVGDHVLLLLKSERGHGGYIKRLLDWTNGELTLHQYNNPPKELKVPLERVHTVHRIVDWEELMEV